MRSILDYIVDGVSPWDDVPPAPLQTDFTPLPFRLASGLQPILLASSANSNIPTTVQPNVAQPIFSPGELAAQTANSLTLPAAAQSPAAPPPVPGAAGLGDVQPIPASVITSGNGDASTGSDAGNAPSPNEYVKRGEFAKQMMTQPNDPEAGAAAVAGGVLYDASQLAQFKRGWPLDAQRYGGSRPYASYGFGLYNAAAGRSLSDALDMADLYGKYFSTYDPKRTPLDTTYKHIPAENVASIRKAYLDYGNGTYKKP